MFPITCELNKFKNKCQLLLTNSPFIPFQKYDRLLRIRTWCANKWFGAKHAREKSLHMHIWIWAHFLPIGLFHFLIAHQIFFFKALSPVFYLVVIPKGWGTPNYFLPVLSQTSVYKITSLTICPLPELLRLLPRAAVGIWPAQTPHLMPLCSWTLRTVSLHAVSAKN